MINNFYLVEFCYASGKLCWWYLYKIDNYLDKLYIKSNFKKDDDWNRLYVKSNFKNNNNDEMMVDDNNNKDKFVNHVISHVLNYQS